ncbi:MAG: P-loop NTPase [Oscillospiraceae bacterium]|jgi:Mrp family chromosome partitioning ATPase
MSETCNNECGSCTQTCSDRKPDSMLEAPHELSRIKKVIAVMSGKGGVGKSLVTSMLAASMQRKGLKAAVLDADITGPSIPKLFGIHQKAQETDVGLFPVRSELGTQIMSLNLLVEQETDPVIWRGPVIGGLVKQFWTEVVWGDVDIMFIDMPPGTGDVPLTVFQTIPVDGVIVVTSPQELVSMIVEKSVKMAEKMQVPILGLVENMSYLQCSKCGEISHPFGESHADEIAKAHGLRVLAKLPIDPQFALASDKGLIEGANTTWLDPLADELEKL